MDTEKRRAFLASEIDKLTREDRKLAADQLHVANRKRLEDNLITLRKYLQETETDSTTKIVGSLASLFLLTIAGVLLSICVPECKVNGSCSAGCASGFAILWFAGGIMLNVLGLPGQSKSCNLYALFGLMMIGPIGLLWPAIYPWIIVSQIRSHILSTEQALATLVPPPTI